ALDAYDRLAEGGVAEPVRPADPFLACFRTADEAAALRDELEQLKAAGLDVRYDLLDGDEVRRLVPVLTEEVGAGVRLYDQRYIHPVRYMEALAAAVRDRGGVIREGVAVREIRDDGTRVAVILENADAGRPQEPAGTPALEGDAVVVASGAELSRLARRFGVRVKVQAGRGYSFSVAVDPMPPGPVYFPVQRVACTPLGDRLRVAGMMEFRAPDEPLDPRRVAAIVKAAQPFFRNVDFSDRRDEWVGSRPCTADGLPLIGPTASERVFVGGGHCMWGIFLGPLTGQLLAEMVVTGRRPPELAPFDPLR
ncbi:MAG TPA: FAD-dependent oxidoreductase, partial [Bacillota bacterium]